MDRSKLACDNCGLDFTNDPGASGKRCPSCKNGAITWVDD